MVASAEAFASTAALSRPLLGSVRSTSSLAERSDRVSRGTFVGADERLGRQRERGRRETCPPHQVAGPLMRFHSPPPRSSWRPGRVRSIARSEFGSSAPRTSPVAEPLLVEAPTRTRGCHASLGFGCSTWNTASAERVSSEPSLSWSNNRPGHGRLSKPTRSPLRYRYEADPSGLLAASPMRWRNAEGAPVRLPNPYATGR